VLFQKKKKFTATHVQLAMSYYSQLEKKQKQNFTVADGIHQMNIVKKYCQNIKMNHKSFL